MMAGSATLLNDPLIQSAEDSRLLIAKRNHALESLNLSEAKTDLLESELRAIGWTEDLASNIPRDKKDMWTENEERALLCIKRHATKDTKNPHILATFFPTRKAIADKWGRLMRAPVEGWEEDDTERLAKLYESGKSFESIQAMAFAQFSVHGLETVYGKRINAIQSKALAAAMKAKKAKKSKKRRAEWDDDSEDELEGRTDDRDEDNSEEDD